MRKLYVMLVCAFVLSMANANAQCPSGRYTDYIFPYTMTDGVVYSSVYNLKMDVYEPQGDMLSERPLIILAHGGSFIGGDRKADGTVDSMCVRFAKRGYVTVSIDYRLAGILEMLDSNTASKAVAKSISDGKACIRYMVQNRSTYRIDTNNIFIGGNSAGAVLFMHVGYIDSVAECSPLIMAALNANGGFDGNSGNPGYTTKCKGVLNLAGALNTISLVGAGSVPSINVQGDQDVVVPYGCGFPSISPTRLCGLGELGPQYAAQGVYNLSKTFVGQGHVPWDSDPAMAKTVDSMVSLFMYNLVCTNIASVNEVRTSTEVNMFPNPAYEVLNMNSTEAIAGVTIIDQTGRVVVESNSVNKLNCSLNTSRLSKGIYLVRVKFVNENNAPVVKRVAIQ